MDYKIKQPIGIFDSGVGGLTVFSEIRKRFPNEDLIYFGDTARVPYGPKSKNTIKEYSIQNTRFLNNFNIKLLIIACNTSSAIAIDDLKQQYDIPIIGVIEPGAAKAVEMTKNGKIGIIGTEGTVNSEAYPNAIKQLKPHMITYSRPCPLFVPLVEEGWQNHVVSCHIAQEYLSPFKKESIDTLVLGCTHYPIIKETIRKTIGNEIFLVDSAEAVAEYLDKYLKTITKDIGKESFFVSDNIEKFRLIASKILQKNIEHIQRVKLGESWYV